MVAQNVCGNLCDVFIPAVVDLGGQDGQQLTP